MLEGAVARCVDLWSDDPEQDICAHGQGKTTEHWYIQLVQDDNSNEASLIISALNVAATSHRLLRIDYLCQEEEETQQR